MVGLIICHTERNRIKRLDYFWAYVIAQCLKMCVHMIACTRVCVHCLHGSMHSNVRTFVCTCLRLCVRAFFQIYSSSCEFVLHLSASKISCMCVHAKIRQARKKQSAHLAASVRVRLFTCPCAPLFVRVCACASAC